ncbi:hypothetical protein COO60DRAFT_1701790 [Scenedesmus sp. NREL 46B-D3]|nr:hypothetical protein COO60DRAFT_1701790 [Scenedesmus sp. NREL 46B-D3]
MAGTCGDLFDGLMCPSFHDTDEPNWLAGSNRQAVAVQHCPASSAALPCDTQHPLLRPCVSEETTEDIFESLDALLAAEFPDLDSDCIPALASPMHSTSYSGSPASTAPPAVACPARSCSSTDSHGIQHMQQQQQQQAFACSSPTSSGAPDMAESAAAAAAAAAAAKAQAQAFASLSGSAFSGMIASDLRHMGSTASTATCSAAVAAATGATGAMPRWKLYHMHQRQQLLAPKAASPGSPRLQVTAGPGAAAAPAATCGSPAPAVLSGAAWLPPGNALASTAAAAGLAAVAVPAQMVGAQQLLLLNLHRQQQLALQQQQQLAVVVGAKRQWAEPVGAPVHVMPCRAKRSRATAAGNTAAQHMYGLSAEPCQQLQTLQLLQLQLQQQIQQNHRQQAEIYQQQQLQALHSQLHMRLQVQLHPLALQPTVPTRHKRYATGVAKR